MRVLGRRAELSVSGGTHQRIGLIGAAQRGRVARRQLKRVGVSEGAITRAVANGMLLPRRRGVFALASAIPMPWTAETEALLAMREDAVLSRLTALALWGLLPSRPDGLAIDVCVGKTGAGRPPGVRVHRAVVASRDVRVRQGLPVTSPSMALVDGAPLLEARRLEQAFEEGVRNGLTSLDELARLIDRLGHRPGVAGVRGLIENYAGSTYTRSEGEALMRSLCDQAGLPRPLGNTRCQGFEVDFLWPEHRVIVEVDGYRFHSARSAFEHDRRKDQILTANGFTVMRITWRQLENDAMAVMVRLGQILGAAGQSRALDG